MEVVIRVRLFGYAQSFNLELYPFIKISVRLGGIRIDSITYTQDKIKITIYC